MALSKAVEIVLGLGDFHFGSGELRIRTLLGSCVAVAVWHPVLRIGGMCHYVIPGEPDLQDPPQPRHAHGAVALFLARMRAAGTAPSEYRAKIFACGAQLQVPAGIPAIDIGALNIEAGMRLIGACGVAITAQHVGGRGPREVIFDMGTGDVWVRHGRTAEDGR